MRIARQRGFTLIEILIAVAILGIGVVGVVALFPATIQSASNAVQDTYSASIADSVVATLSAARRDHKIFRALPGAAPGTPPTKYLIFDHDGVLDALVTPAPAPGGAVGSAYYAANWMKDYMVLLPRATTQKNANPNNEPTILFPYWGGPPNRAPATIGAGIADEVQLKPTVEGKLVIWVQKTYPCGRFRENTPGMPAGFATGDIRPEFLPPGSTNAKQVPVDMYPQYSFAFTLRRARSQATNCFSSRLYETHVLVYRNFDASAALQAAIAAGGPIPKSNEPVHEFVTMIDVGPKGDVGGGGFIINGQALNSPPGPPTTPTPPTGDAAEADPLDEW